MSAQISIMGFGMNALMQISIVKMVLQQSSPTAQNRYDKLRFHHKYISNNHLNFSKSNKAALTVCK